MTPSAIRILGGRVLDAKLPRIAEDSAVLIGPNGERLPLPASAYAEAYAGFFADELPENGVPCRFTVHLVDVPDKAASYEFYSVALLQRSLQPGR